jgi:NTE family protein
MNNNIINNIEHIVLSGGAYLGLYEFGALKFLEQNNFFKLKNIKSIHGTSIGGLLGAILCLKIDWIHLNDYFIKRPWYKTIQMTPNMFFDVIPNKGLLGSLFFENLLKPLLKSNDLSMDITLKELYEFSNIELFMYSVNLNNYKLEQLNYKTHPELKLVQAVHMTCALPYIFQPVWYNNSFYVDGGLINNYPLNICYNLLYNNLNDELKNIENIETIIKNKILGIKLENHNDEEDNIKVKENMNIFEYGYFLYKQIVQSNKKEKEETIKNEIVIPCGCVNISEGYEIMMESSKREKYIIDGEKFANVFLKYIS